MAKSPALRVSLARSLLALVFGAPILLCTPLFAMDIRALDRRVIERIRTAPAKERIVLEGVILSDAETRTIVLEEFWPYAPDAAILVYDSDRPRRIAPPARRYFRGSVAGDPTATVFFSVSKTGSEVDGRIVIGEKTFAIGQARALPGKRPANAQAAPILVAEVEPYLSASAQKPFQCAIEHANTGDGRIPRKKKVSNAATVQGNSSSTPLAYEFRVAVETDNELYSSFGTPGTATDTAVNNYIGNLVAQTAVIYLRDLNTTLQIGQVNIRPSNVPDPFQEEDNAFTALGEFGTYWHNNHPAVVRSLAVMASGKPMMGIAWVDRLCRNDFFCGAGCFGNPATANQWGGAYAFNGSFTGETIIPDANATVNGVLYGLPIDNYWMLQGFAHEIGHVIGSPHTHCVALTDEDKTLYNVTRDFVDQCFSTSQYGCFSGTASIPAEKGTIMSYCYLQTSGPGYPESRYTFGDVGNTSAKMLEILREGFEFASPSADITVGNNLPCASQQIASISTCSDCTYSWSIGGGTIQGSTTGASISFTPTSSSVTLTAAAANDHLCKVTASAITTSLCASTLATATNFLATAATGTSVSMTWDAVSGATSYEVARSSNGTAYTTVGTPAGLAFTDSSAAMNTAYLYKVRARDASLNTGSYSTPNIATTVIFTEDPLTVRVTTVKGIHLTELRTAVNAARVLAQQGATTFTDPINTSLAIKRIHIVELRSNLDSARAVLGLGPVVYTDPAITVQSTTIQAAHWNDLRSGVK